MPIFEYQCVECRAIFERLTFGASSGVTPTCPQCTSPNTAKRLSTFSTNTGTTIAATPSGAPAFS